jgi:protein-disulfide isomerase
VTVVEFGDVQCPFCRGTAADLEKLAEAYPGKVRFAWKHRPQQQHALATPAALLAEAARSKGGDAAFWRVIDGALLADPLDEGALAWLGTRAGVDLAGVKADQAQRLGLLDRIRRDQNLAFALGVTGTPTLFVNGRRIAGQVPYAALEAIVKEELARAEALVRTGVAPGEVYARLTAKGATAPVLVAAAPAGPRTGVEVAARADAPSRGPADAKVTIVEFSDFQCPFCARAAPEVNAILGESARDVRVVYRHLPLSFHGRALPAALAAEAAAAQGKFWELHDRLFAAPAALEDADLTRHARALGLDLDRFEADRKAPATRERVEADAAAAAAAGLTATPSFVVNGEVVVGAGRLRDAVKRSLQRKLAER